MVRQANRHNDCRPGTALRHCSHATSLGHSLIECPQIDLLATDEDRLIECNTVTRQDVGQCPLKLFLLQIQRRIGWQLGRSRHRLLWLLWLLLRRRLLLGWLRRR